jgi:hypothetical protein
LIVASTVVITYASIAIASTVVEEFTSIIEAVSSAFAAVTVVKHTTFSFLIGFSSASLYVMKMKDHDIGEKPVITI